MSNLQGGKADRAESAELDLAVTGGGMAKTCD